MPDDAQPDSGGGTGWRVRTARLVTDSGWDAQPPPLPPSVAVLPPGSVQVPEMAPGPPAPPPLQPLGPFSTPPSRPPMSPSPGGRPRRPLRARLAIITGVVLIAGVAGIGIYTAAHPSPTVGVPLSTPPPTTLAVVHSGPAVLELESLTGSGTMRTLRLPGTPEQVLETPDRSKAFLLDTDHGDVIPVDLVTGHVGSPIAVGKLPVDEALSADASTLYITDNLGGTVIPINASTGRVEPARPLTQGVSFYIPSPTGSGALVGAATAAGQPGVVYFQNPATGPEAPLEIGTNPVQSAFYSTNGATVWVDEEGANSGPGELVPIDVASQTVGTPIKLGVAPSAWAVTPDGGTDVVVNEVDNTLSIVNLLSRRVVATVPLGATPTGVAIDATGATAWVACALQRSLVPVSLTTHRAGAPIALGNAPGDLAMPAAPGVAWVLFPSSNGTVNFLKDTPGRVRTIAVGNDPEVLMGSGSESSWVANSLNDTVQRLDVAAQSAGPAIPVARAPADLQMTPDGRTLLVLSFGDGRHAGMLTAIDTSTSAQRTPLSVGPRPSDLTVSPTGGLAFVADYRTNSISIVDVTHWRADGTIALPCGPTSLAVTPDGTTLFAACGDSARVVPISVSNHRLGTAIAVTSDPRLVTPLLGTTLIVAGSNALQALDTNTETIVRSQAESGNLVDVVETTDGSMLLAVDNSGAALVEISPDTLATEKSIAVGTRPGEVVLSPDNSHAYVLDSSEQKLYAIDLAAWVVKATISVSPNATAIVAPAPVVIPAT